MQNQGYELSTFLQYCYVIIILHLTLSFYVLFEITFFAEILIAASF